jgi:hypothetical protein
MIYQGELLDHSPGQSFRLQELGLYQSERIRFILLLSTENRLRGLHPRSLRHEFGKYEISSEKVIFLII